MSRPPPVLHTEEQPEDSSEYKLRRQLLLLAMLVVSVTYVAGQNPPGGIWQEDGPGGVTAGEPILRSTHYRRYLAFFYCNATALATSLVVIFLLLLKHPNKLQLTFLRFIMVLDLLGLMGAYLAGSCREKPATVYTAALVLALSAYVGVHILQALSHSQSAGLWDHVTDEHHPRENNVAIILRPKERSKVLLLLATFLAALTYVAGLNPPGGFWDTLGNEGGTAYRLGDSLVEAHHGGHFRMFFYCNTTAFIASLFIIVLLLGKDFNGRTSPSFALQVFVLGALLGLLAAYAAGSCRKTDSSVYVVSIFGAVLAFIFLAMVIIISLKRLCGNPQNQSAVKSLVLLLANLVATITYKAGLDPPGGFWPDDRDGHGAGDSILMWTHPMRYKVFFYCNSISFVASLVAILMVQNAKLVKSRTLLVAMMLNMFALIGAYAAGSCRDLQTSFHVLILAAAVLVYVVIHILFTTLGAEDTGSSLMLEKKHKWLLLLAILVATITYQVGLTPPAGFWMEDGKRHLLHHAGDVVLLDGYPRRYRVFFYSNTVSFMASIAIILLLVNPNLSRLAIRCYALYVCQVAGLFGLLGAYAAGTARSVKTSIYVFILVAAVIAFIVVHIIVFDFLKRRSRESNEAAVTPAMAEELPRRDADEANYLDEVYGKTKYLMLLGILAASVTYEAGLAPPGGLWQDDGHGVQREAGNPVLHDTDARRYHIFFYSNSTSFVASMVIITLLLQEILRKQSRENRMLLLLATNIAVVLDVLGLMVAYAAGSTREWGNLLVLSFLIVLLMAAHVGIWMFNERRRCSGPANSTNERRRPPVVEEHVENGHDDQLSHARET
ncbi:hypothetical protein PR202_gb03444 [Eleusine coracana subsp. coracana]|uniref:PGG domain-containing protein n=1 Tax=Eleusine coracana subsp. coracana TaxID=191504 RepID=A0AAV5E1V3_ELECO|nr:hypothetical protein PR202_gb03444 [Eleusine coracana subsp. coracana]